MGYKIAVIIVIFQLIAELVVNILLLHNENQYSIRICFIGHQTFCFLSLVIFAPHVPFHPKCHHAPRLGARGSQSLSTLLVLLLQSLFINQSILLSGLQQRLDDLFHWEEESGVSYLNLYPLQLLPDMSILKMPIPLVYRFCF